MWPLPRLPNSWPVPSWREYSDPILHYPAPRDPRPRDVRRGPCRSLPEGRMVNDCVRRDLMGGGSVIRPQDILKDAIELALEGMMALAIVDLVLFHNEKPAKLKRDLEEAQNEKPTRWIAKRFDQYEITDQSGVYHHGTHPTLAEARQQCIDEGHAWIECGPM